MSSAPVDPTTTAAWARLRLLAERARPDLRRLLADEDRVERLTLEAADLHVDLSKNLVDEEVLALHLLLAEAAGQVEPRRGAAVAAAVVDVRRVRDEPSPPAPFSTGSMVGRSHAPPTVATAVPSDRRAAGPATHRD